jgi:hypothetical protein
MSGGAFGYKEFYLDQLHDAIECRRDEELCNETREYMSELMLDIRLLRERIKRLDYYLSGDSLEYK